MRALERYAGLTRATAKRCSMPARQATGHRLGDLADGGVVERNAAFPAPSRVRRSTSPGSSTSPPGAAGGDALTHSRKPSTSRKERGAIG